MNLALGVYVFFIVASTVLAESPWFAWNGAPDRQEGTPVLLSYLALVWIAARETAQKGFARAAVVVILGGGVVMSVIGGSQLLGYDLVKTELGNWVVPRKFEGIISSAGLIQSSNWVYGLLPNPNYMGGYAAMLMVLSFGILWFWQGWKAGVGVGLNCLFFTIWLGSRSKAGLLSGTLGMLLVIVFGRSKWREKLIHLIILGFAYGAIFLVADTLSMRISKSGSQRLLYNLTPDRIAHQQSAPSDLVDLILASDSFELIHFSSRIRCQWSPVSGFRFYNQKGEMVPYEVKGQTLLFPSGQFRGSLVKVATESKVVQITREDVVYNVMYTEQGFRLLDPWLRPVQVREARRWGFAQSQRWGNGRGYIWSRSLPLLWDAMLMGFGPDMFVYAFPNDDYLSKVKAGYPFNWLVDKPHNLYLQIGINTGGISLMAFLFLCGRWLWESCRLYWHSTFERSQEKLGLTVAAAGVAYLIAGMFNDSVVAVATIFWVLLGIGIGLILQENKRLLATLSLGGKR
jgi:hypothetical protein